MSPHRRSLQRAEDAKNNRSLRLGARIWDLRQRGWVFETDERPDKNTLYCVIKAPAPAQLSLV
jgi:hypothetical protein